MKKILNLSEIIKIVIFFVIFTLVLVIFNIPGIKKLNRTYQTLKTEELALKGLASEQQATEIKQNYELWQKTIPDFPALLPKNGEELALITTLEKLAQDQSLSQKLNLSQTKAEFSEHIDSLSLAIELKGDFLALLNYLTELKKMPLRLSLNSLHLKQTETEILEAQFLTNTYWLK